VPIVRRLLIGLVAGLALAAGLVTPAATASAAPPAPGNQFGIRLLDAPETAAADPRAREYVVDHVAPGTVLERRVEVSNTTAAPLTLALYAAAATIDGAAFTPATGRTPDELSTWISTDRPTVTLAPGASQAALMTIAVPADAAPGENYAAIWAEQATTPPPGGGVTLVNRVGIRVYLSVGPGNPPPTSFTVDTVTAERSATGQPLVVAQLRNTGGRALDLSGDLRLSDGPGGLGAGPFPAQVGTTVAPGATEPVTVALDRQLPDGPWGALLTLRSGLVSEDAQATIRFPASAGSSDPVRPTGDESGLLWTVGLTGGLLAVLLVAVVVLLVRRRRSPRGRHLTSSTDPRS
jgi:hypothetical protein